jgi:hypothetical protein
MSESRKSFTKWRRSPSLSSYRSIAADTLYSMSRPARSAAWRGLAGNSPLTPTKSIHRLAQAGKFALIIQDDDLNAGTLGDEAQQPRLAATRIRLDQKPGIDQRWQVTFELPSLDNLSNDHRPYRSETTVLASMSFRHEL